MIIFNTKIARCVIYLTQLTAVPDNGHRKKPKKKKPIKHKTFKYSVCFFSSFPLYLFIAQAIEQLNVCGHNYHM